jgi:hypothetical protein
VAAIAAIAVTLVSKVYVWKGGMGTFLTTTIVAVANVAHRASNHPIGAVTVLAYMVRLQYAQSFNLRFREEGLLNSTHAEPVLHH